MELTTQISYNGFSAYYKITTLNSTLYRAELTEFSGINTEPPPSPINFIKINGRPIANVDVLYIVKDFLKQMRLKNISR